MFTFLVSCLITADLLWQPNTLGAEVPATNHPVTEKGGRIYGVGAERPLLEL